MQGFGQLLGALIKERREAAGLTQIELAEESFPDLTDHDGKERRIRELEAGDVTRPQAKNYTPICETLNIDRNMIRNLKVQAADAKEQQESEFEEAFGNEDDVNQAFNDTGDLTRDQLELLASRFEIENPHSLSDAVLQDLLTKKAEEYRALKSEVDAIDDGLKRLSNLKAAAQGAIARVDLEEVEELLSRVQEVELEEAAKTAELRANNALLRGKVDQAYQILSAAADSFAVVDPIEPSRRRVSYEDRLYAHGLRYGGQGMALSEAMLRAAITSLDKEEQPELWSNAQNSLAIALQDQGKRTEGATGTTLLADAVTAYNAVLTVRTKDAYPVEWAMTQNNLGIALQNQGTRTEGAAGTNLLSKAVTAHNAVLTVFTKDAHAVQRAVTQNNLGTALSDQGMRGEGAAGTALLAGAVTAYTAALNVYTKDAHPVHWAMTQNNLGIALRNQGTRTEGAAGTALLADAVAAYNAALTVTTKDAHPVDWAETQENLATTEEAIAEHPATTDLRPHLEAALAHVEAALTIFDPEHMSFHFEKATRIRDRLKEKLNTLPQV